MDLLAGKRILRPGRLVSTRRMIMRTALVAVARRHPSSLGSVRASCLHQPPCLFEQVCAAFRDHHGWDARLATNDLGHDRGVYNP